MIAAPLLDKVMACQRRLGLDGEGMVVAVSGGPDSMALARALVTLRARADMGPLVLAHLNHQLRGAESDADEAFVREQFGVLGSIGDSGWRLHCARRDVAALARAEKGNLESVARRLRYDWLAQVARQESVRFVATGHTIDDQAETVLHRLLRGAGLKGMRGILERRPLADEVEVIRPLLHVTRAEVIDFLETSGQPSRHDRSNLDRRFTRNRIRQELLPLLKEHYNPRIAGILGQLAEHAGEAYARHEEEARLLLARAERPRAGTLLIFDRQALTEASRHLVREGFRLVWRREGWPMDGMNFRAWDRLADVAIGASVAVALPGRVQARCRGRVVQVGRNC